jgi:hypothetical protein
MTPEENSCAMAREMAPLAAASIPIMAITTRGTFLVSVTLPTLAK